MSSTDQPLAVSKSAFLDTNALINLFDYWTACKSAGIQPVGVTTWSALKAALQKKNKWFAHVSGNDVGSMTVGMTCFDNLNNYQTTYQYYTSSICRSEMHHVILDDLAMERLIRKGIPHRMRVKRPQVLYRKVLESRDYRKVRDDLSEFFESFRLDYGIDIIEVEESAAGTAVTFGEVLSTAQEVWSRLLIEVMDSYIYAAAIAIEADVFLTSDGPLIGALNNLVHPNDEWASAVSSLKCALGMPAGASFPRPVRPSHKFSPY